MMRRALLAALLALASPAAAQTPAPEREAYAVQAGHLIVDAAQPARGPSTLIVENGRVARIEQGWTSGPAGATVVDLRSKTVLPGLVDVHVHLEHSADTDDYFAQRSTEPFAVAVGLRNARLTAQGGFTTVRNVGGSTLASLAIRDAVNAGLHPGPRILTSGRELSITGGAGDTTSGLRPDFAEALDAHRPQPALCHGAEGCTEAVRQAAKLGVDVIKIYATGAALGDQGNGLEQQFTDEEMRAIVEAAHRAGLKVAAHAHGAGGVAAAVRAGVDSIEHGTFADEVGIREMKARGTYLVATLRPAEMLEEGLRKGRFSPRTAEKARAVVAQRGKALAAAYRAHVPLALGSDAGVFPHGRNGEELGLMVRYGGMTPRDALIAATKGGAALLGLAEETGTLEPGKSADLIAVDGDPLSDPEAVLKVAYVMVRGKQIPLH